LLSEGGGDDADDGGSPPAAQIEASRGFATSAVENIASVVSLIANLLMHSSC
jgi:hypothetical protein